MPAEIDLSDTAELEKIYARLETDLAAVNALPEEEQVPALQVSRKAETIDCVPAFAQDLGKTKELPRGYSCRRSFRNSSASAHASRADAAW